MFKYFAVILMVAISGMPAHAVDFSKTDKQAHFLGGCAIALLVRGAVKDNDAKYASGYGLLTGTGAAIAKELYDHHFSRTHTYDPQDAYATIIGATVCVSLAETYEVLFSRNSVEISTQF